MVKIFNNNEVYIFLKNAKEMHPDISFDVPVYTIGNTEGLIKEADYNNILLQNNKEVASLSVTKVKTLEAEVEAMQALRPIKHLFLSKYGMSDEEIQKKIFKEEIEKVKKFVENLNKKVETPIIMWDERLSTHGADRLLTNACIAKSKRKAYIDKIAASFILEGFLHYCKKTYVN